MKKHCTTVFCLSASLLLMLGCSHGNSPVSPLIEADECNVRQSMWFQSGTETIFGNPSCPATEVDMATVLWSYDTFIDPPDEINWVVAVGTEDPPGSAQTAPSYPVVRFIGRNTDAEPVLGATFEVQVYPEIEYRECRLPKVDCMIIRDPETQEDYLNVMVIYRYSKAGYTFPIMEDGWDVRLTRLRFAYDAEEEEPEDKWVLYDQTQLPIPGGEDEDVGETHPDISYDLCSGDIYCIWCEHTTHSSDILYNRCRIWYDFQEEEEVIYWASQTGWTLKYPYKSHGPWYPSIDIGLVEGTNPSEPEEVHRVVAFAYTGWFQSEPFPAPNLWGFRPVVGWWYIDDCVPDDDDHPAITPIYNPAFPPNNPNEPHNGRKYNAGMARIDIPWDSTEPHNASMVYIQDTETDSDGELQGIGYYEAYGMSSLVPSRHDWLSQPSDPEHPEFTAATLPSLAVNSTDGANVSVSFFAALSEPATDWQAWATLWDIAAGTVSAIPTKIDDGAEGESNFDESFISNDWGTASSIVMIDQGLDFYWAAWSDKFGAFEPSRVRGALGFANP